MALRLEWEGPYAGPAGEAGWCLLLDIGDPVLVSRSRTTRTEAGDLLLPRGPVPVHRKVYDYPSVRSRLSGAFRTTFAAPGRARRERGALLRLRNLGEPLLAPEPVALGERRSAGFLVQAVLAVRTIGGGRNLEEAEASVTLARETGRAAGRMHAAGYGGLDLSPRNLVAAPGRGGAPQVFKVDSGRMRRASLGGPLQAGDLADLLAGLENRWTSSTLEELRAAYAAVVGDLPAGLERAMPEARARPLRRRPRA